MADAVLVEIRRCRMKLLQLAHEARRQQRHCSAMERGALRDLERRARATARSLTPPRRLLVDASGDEVRCA